MQRNPDAAPASGSASEAVEPPVAQARRLMRSLDRAALSTLSARADSAGWPSGSFTLTALDHDLSPILLMSGLAQHSRNLAADDRCCLLFDETAGLDEPMTGARVSAMGRARPMGRDPGLAARYLAHHPASEGFLQLGDFQFYKVELHSVQLIAGFGRAHRFSPEELREDPGAVTPPALVAAEAEILAHMNEAHRPALAVYARRLGLPEGDWRLVGIDAEGADLRWGGKIGRLQFPAPCLDVDAAHQALVALARS